MRNTKKPIQLYRGTTQQHSNYAGPVGEITVDTEKYTVVVQNGVTGGVPLAREDTVVSLTNRIAAEESARATADTALQNDIASEASARETADTALSNRLDVVEPVLVASDFTGDTNTVKKYVDVAMKNRAPLASPALTGVPTAPTAAPETNTTQIATTAFVQASEVKVMASVKNNDALVVHLTGDETISGTKTFIQTIAGTAAAAEKLATARTITLSGAASGSVSFDGSADATLEVSIGGNQGAVIGEVRWFAMSTPPEGWLVCNGASVGTSDYAALFAAIGNIFLPEGVPASPATFKLPNLMGKVPWGSSSQVGTEIKAGAPNIKGQTNNPVQTFSWNNSMNAGIGAIVATPVNPEMAGTHGNGYGGVWIDFDASKSNPIYGRSDTVQPPALCLLPCIRYE